MNGLDYICDNNWKKPSVEMVKSFTLAYDICFYKSEKELQELFNAPIKKEIIESRVKMLNSTYHTRLMGDELDDLSNYIFNQGIDLENRILGKDYTVVKELAFVGHKNRFVFASKYCAFVSPDGFPIFDAIVGKTLTWFQKHYSFYKENLYLRLDKDREEGNYHNYVDIIDAFIQHFELSNCSYREVDKFLWIVGTNYLQYVER